MSQDMGASEQMLWTEPTRRRLSSKFVSMAVGITLVVGGCVTGGYYLATGLSGSAADGACAAASITLVQSIPIGDFSISRVSGAIPTHEAFLRLADTATSTLDVTAMYVDLLGTEDQKFFNKSQMDNFGAARGAAVFAALDDAGRRGVAVRLLLGIGVGKDPLNSTEVRRLLLHPSVQARTWAPKQWYGGGIMHMKLWHSDRTAAYVGSANPDWKSLAQVKELGLLINGSAVRNDSSAADPKGATRDLGAIFEVFWRWANPALVPTQSKVWSEAFQTTLTLPPWDPAVPAEDRSVSPISSGLKAVYNAENQQPVCSTSSWSQTPGSVPHAFVTASPGGAVTDGRTPDIDALLLTIRSATTNLSLNVMDFLPASAFDGGHGGAPIYWPALTDAIISVAYAKPVRVRLLVSKWAHTGWEQAGAMRQLADGLQACAHAWQRCAGSLEVRQYVVPGWNLTKGASPTYPSFTRVNHQKYIVSDKRLNVGTSNWQWGYFHNTAGTSYNTDDPELVAAAQAVFDADWESPYAEPCCD